MNFDLCLKPIDFRNQIKINGHSTRWSFNFAKYHDVLIVMYSTRKMPSAGSDDGSMEFIEQ